MLGTIYNIRSKLDDKFYIGSTIQPLSKRLKNHKSKAKEELRKNTPLYLHFNACGWLNAEIIPIRVLQINEQRQLLAAEKEEIIKNLTNPNCLNVARPCITHQEKKDMDKQYGKKRRQEKKQAEQQRVIEWRLNNPEKYAEQKRRAAEKIKAKRQLEKNSKVDTKC